MHRFIIAATVAAFALAAPAAAQQGQGQHGKHGQGMQHGTGGQHGGGENHAASGWKALDDYHGFMMASWHPAKENGNLAPARQVAAAMAKQADVFAAATPPKGCDTKELKAAIADVRTQTHAFAKLVADQADDAALKTALSALHDRFEVVEHGCHPAKD